MTHIYLSFIFYMCKQLSYAAVFPQFSTRGSVFIQITDQHSPVWSVIVILLGLILKKNVFYKLCPAQHSVQILTLFDLKFSWRATLGNVSSTASGSVQHCRKFSQQ